MASAKNRTSSTALRQLSREQHAIRELHQSEMQSTNGGSDQTVNHDHLQALAKQQFREFANSIGRYQESSVTVILDGAVLL